MPTGALRRGGHTHEAAEEDGYAHDIAKTTVPPTTPPRNTKLPGGIGGHATPLIWTRRPTVCSE